MNVTDKKINLVIKSQEDLEKMLLEGLNSDYFIEITDQWWENKRKNLLNKVNQKHQNKD